MWWTSQKGSCGKPAACYFAAMHAADRLARMLRKPVLFCAVLALPVAVVGYAYMCRDMAVSAPWWVSAPVIIAQLIGIAGVAFLIDSLQERLSRQEHSRQTALARSSEADHS